MFQLATFQWKKWKIGTKMDEKWVREGLEREGSRKRELKMVKWRGRRRDLFQFKDSKVMLSTYRLILNYNFVSFLVFCSHFYVSFYVFFLQVTKAMKMHKRSWKASKWMQTDESRQRVLAAANTNLTAVKTTLTAANANFIAAKNLRIKWRQKQSEPIRCSRNIQS